MTRFRRSGLNWEGRPWRTSSGLNALMDEIEAAWPNQGPADGTVASKRHDAVSPNSDHRPRPTVGAGVVRAVDAGEYVEGQGEALAEALLVSRDPRIRYVIHEDRIFSSYSTSHRPSWTWGTYSGSNAHLNHVHVSLNRLGDEDGSPFQLDLEGEDVRELVMNLQQALLDAGHEPGPIDGIYGPKTHAALVAGLGKTPDLTVETVEVVRSVS